MSGAEIEINRERLLRAIRCLQLIQRTNAPKTTIFKAAGKALVPLMAEQATLPPAPPKAAKPPKLELGPGVAGASVPVVPNGADADPAVGAGG